MEGYRTEQESLNSTIHETVVHNGSIGGGSSLGSMFSICIDKIWC